MTTEKYFRDLRVTGYENVSSDIFGFVKGRMYENWIRDSSKIGQPILNPVYLIESLFRDECFTERDIQITETPIIITNPDQRTQIQSDGLLVNIDNYYAGAWLHNITRNVSSEILSSSGGYVVISGAHSEFAIGDNIIISNIQGDNKISSESFDNTYNNNRISWQFTKSFVEQDSAATYINQALYESQCILDKSQGRYKTIATDKDINTANVLSKPILENGKPKVELGLIPLSDIYTSFLLSYAYDYGKGEYERTISVDYKGGVENLRDKCRQAERTYKIKRSFEHQCGFIYDDNTASLLLSKLVEKHTKQRLVVGWYATPKEALKYTVGDQVKINYPDILPSGINNTAIFMITKVQPIIKLGSPEIYLTLEEMP